MHLYLAPMHSHNELLSIYDRNRDELVRFSMSIVGDMAAAEDVLQEAWMKFVRAARKQHIEVPLAYLRTIVRTLSLDARRKITRDTLRVVQDSTDLDAVVDPLRPDPEQIAIDRNEIALLRQAIAELPDRTQRALKLYWQEERTLRDVAAALDVSLGQAHALVKHGVEHCRQRLNRPKMH